MCDLRDLVKWRSMARVYWRAWRFNFKTPQNATGFCCNLTKKTYICSQTAVRNVRGNKSEIVARLPAQRSISSGVLHLKVQISELDCVIKIPHECRRVTRRLQIIQNCLRVAVLVRYKIQKLLC